jgi:hypothetical protein
MYIENPKTKGSGILCAIPQGGICPINCADCFFQSGRSYLEPLDINLPNLPSLEESLGKIVRVNDGNDSNNKQQLVIDKTSQYRDKFYNTSIPRKLEEFNAPVVLTVNPDCLTDQAAHYLEKIPNNLMFVRVRVNTWNLNLIDSVVQYYNSKNVVVVLTFMAYFNLAVPAEEMQKYEFKQRTVNSYWVIKEEFYNQIVNKYKNYPLVYTCGKDNKTYSCSRCGVCLREYFVTKTKTSK